MELWSKQLWSVEQSKEEGQKQTSAYHLFGQDQLQSAIDLGSAQFQDSEACREGNGQLLPPWTAALHQDQNHSPQEQFLPDCCWSLPVTRSLAPQLTNTGPH